MGTVTSHTSCNKAPVGVRSMAQWIQAFTTLAVLLLIYLANTSSQGAPSSISLAASEPKIGYEVIQSKLLFNDIKTKVVLYTNAKIEQIAALHTSHLARSYTQLADGVAMIEGDIASIDAQKILEKLR